MRFLALAAAFVMPASAANSMTVATFVAKADALSGKGPLALFSSDYGLLKKEVIGSMASLRDERLQALKSGGKPSYCPSAQSGSIGVDEVMAAMNAVPPADRTRLDVKDALRIHMAKRFPCKG